MTGSIPLLYLHYPNDLMGTRPWQTGKSAAHCLQAAPEIQIEEWQGKKCIIFYHYINKNITIEDRATPTSSFPSYYS